MPPAVAVLVCQSVTENLLRPAPMPPRPHEPQAMPPHQALQVLTLAQRTAEEHLTAARHEADQIRAAARATADRAAQEAGDHVHAVRAEADRVLTGARHTAEQTTRDARARADEIRHEADKVLAAAREEAQSIVDAGREQAARLTVQAQHRYEAAVGGLASQRAALQGQIQALEEFDGEYRRRLTFFVQDQLRALWAEPAPDDRAPGLAAGGSIILGTQ